MVMASWLKKKLDEWDERKFAEKLDRLYGTDTHKRLEEERRQRHESGRPPTDNGA